MHAEVVRLVKEGRMPEASKIARAILSGAVKSGEAWTIADQRRISQIGTKLAAIIERETGEHVDCKSCRNEIGRLNAMTSAQVLIEIDAIAEKIVERAKTRSRAWWQRLAAKTVPGLAKKRVMAWISEAAQD